MSHLDENESSQMAVETSQGSLDVQPIHPLDLRPSVVAIYPIFIVINGAVFFLAIPLNSYVIIKTLTTKQARNSRLLHFLTNAAVSDLFKLILALPITLVNLLLRNFVFGSVLCYALPMLQIFPIHTSIFVYAGLAYDRYRTIRYPDKKGIPVMVFSLTSWVVAFCSVLPYSSFLLYYDMADHDPRMEGFFACYVQAKGTENVLRATFFMLFLIPSVVIMSFLMATSWELNFQRKLIVATCVCDEACVMKVERVNDASLTIELESDGSGRKGASLLKEVVDAQDPDQLYRKTYSSPRERIDSEQFEARSIMGVECLFCTTEIQWRDQRRITVMTSLFILAWSPINIFSLATYFMEDSVNEPDPLIDIINLILTWIGFLSTCVNPFIITSLLRDRKRAYRTCQGKPKVTPPSSGRSRSKGALKSGSASRAASPTLPRSSYTPSDSYDPHVKICN